MRTARSAAGWPSGPRRARQLLRLALATIDWMIGLGLTDLSTDGAITKAPGGGDVAGRSPVDRGKQGLKRSVTTDGADTPLHLVAAPANDHDSPLREPTLIGIYNMSGPLPTQPTMHLDRSYDSTTTHDLLDIFGYHSRIATTSTPP